MQASHPLGVGRNGGKVSHLHKTGPELLWDKNARAKFLLLSFPQLAIVTKWALFWALKYAQ